jgi:predicted dehydrogenase
MEDAMQQTRRSFLRNTGAAAAVYKLVDGGFQMRAAGPNDQIGLGFIGVGIRGSFLLEGFQAIPGVRPIIAADVYDGHLEHAKEVTEGKIETTRDYHAVIARKDVDAVVIATPDHWHRQMMLDALAAGKHVYIEKPISWSIEQGRELVAAAEKSGKVVMVGSGAKTSPLTAKAKEIIKSGALGKVNMVRMENNRNNPEGAWVYPVPPDASQKTIDWQRFIGPSPKRAYDPKVFFRWRCWWEYSGGVATDLFVHMLSQMHEFMDVTGPKSVVSNGGIYRWDDGRTVPDVMNSVYEYPQNFIADIYVNLGNSHGISGTVVMGSEGTLIIGDRGAQRNQLMLYPEPKFSEAQNYAVACWPKKMREEYFASFAKAERPSRPQPKPIPIERGAQHHEYFILSLREGLPSKETAAEGHYAAGAAHLANVAFRKGRRMHWDLKTGKVTEA